METRFSARQSVEIAVPELAQPIGSYLRQGDRIVYALAGNGEILPLGADLYQLRLRPLGLFALNVQPIVDIRVWTTEDDTLHVQSVNYQILGLESLGSPNFELRLEGQLYPINIRRQLKLQGHVNLNVQVDVPKPIALTPKAILETTGNAVMTGVLATMKQRLMKNLVSDYQTWVRQQQLVATSR
jgi:hypothetical protein